MPSESSPDVKFEIGHVLFIDIVGYSKLLIYEQSEQLQTLKEIVRGTEQFRQAEAEGKLLRLPTGDGGALVFRNTAEAPVLCALEVSKALKANPELRLRMGIHSGPVNEVTDLNEQANMAGAGINFAQRVMDCGDTGHILLSKRVAEDLAQYRQWQPRLHDLGEVEVKHGARVHIFNLYTDELGNSELPEKLRAAKVKEQTSAAADASLRQSAGFWIAVLPFKYSGGNADIAALSDGLTEEIASGLSRFSYLRVIAGGATSRYAQQTVDVRLAGKELGARYVMEGSVRQSGNKLRIAVQLLDSKSGANLWTETFDRDLQTADIFELQDELTDRVVATVADQYGVLARSMAMATAAKSPETMTPYEAVLRFFLYAQRVTPEDHRLTRTALEHAVKTQPDYADAWAGLATMIIEEHRISFNPQPNSLDRALQSAQRAVDADPASQTANYALAVAHYFRGDLGAFRSAAERALALNARESSVMAYLGMLFCFSGDWERGLPLTARAMNLNPHHAGWYHFAPFFNQYRQRHYAEALAIAQKINLPESWTTHYVTAIAQAHLGNRPAAQAAVERTLRLWPDFEQNFVAEHLQKWVFNQPELIAHVVEGLELAGFRLLRPEGEAVDRSGERGN